MAIDLSRAGAQVIALARSQAALERLGAAIADEGGLCRWFVCDLGDPAALPPVAARIEADWSRLDILVGNAGMLGPMGPVAALDPDGWDATFAVNVGANVRLIRAFDRLLRASDAGRVVFVSSSVAHKAMVRPFQAAYAASKAALDAMMRSYAAETAATRIRVMSVNPGALRTEMRAEAVPGEDPSSLTLPEALSPRIVELCLPTWSASGQLYDFPSDRILSFRPPA